VTCVSLFVILFYHMMTTALTSAIALGVTLAVSFLFELGYRCATGRTFKEVLRHTEPASTSATSTT
jgi:hypothetical protein